MRKWQETPCFGALPISTLLIIAHLDLWYVKAVATAIFQLPAACCKYRRLGPRPGHW
jgi:hypothetical protein